MDERFRSTMNTIVINDLTCLDCALLFTNKGEPYIMGASYMVNAEVTGNLDNTGVVADFSDCKKSIKAKIDDSASLSFNIDTKEPLYNVSGLDHRLIIYKGIKKQLELAGYTFSVTEDNLVLRHEKTNTEYLNVPINAVAFVTDIREAIERRSSTDTYSVKATISGNHTVMYNESLGTSLYIQYAHGLPKSTSYGCKNLVHGHTSMIGSSSKLASSELSRALGIRHATDKQLLKPIYVVNRDYIQYEDATHIIVGYSIERGSFSYRIDKDIYSIWILDCETTCENILDYLGEKLKESDVYNSQLRGTKLYISEGLTKGAIKTLQ